MAHTETPNDPAPFVARRQRLAALLGDTPALISAGHAPSRNYPANTYPFRPSSHFLYLTGLWLPGAHLLLAGGRSTLLLPEREEDDALWHGPQPTPPALGARCGVDEVQTVAPGAALAALVAGLPSPGRLPLPTAPGEADERLAQAIITLRLQHDEAATRELRRAAAATTEAHLSGMRATRPGVRESDVRAAMERPLLGLDFSTSYSSIVTVRGEVLHNNDRSGTCQAGDLLLADVGAETDTGWAGDVTRTWPVSGRFSPTQREIYDLVLEAQRAAIAAVRPGVGYRDVHLAASRVIAGGLCTLGLLRGDPDGLVERGAHALFFPHGVGHLLGLDVHDMEDLGDRAGYAPGRQRSQQFGLSYLRLDRDLAPGMAVTIEPGIYFVPSILARLGDRFASDLCRERLDRFADVRGVRIEDDVLVTEAGCEVLTAAIPKEPAAVEAAMGL